MASTDLTATRLREVLHYCPDTGVFTWRVATGRRVKVGAVAGSPGGGTQAPYLRISIDGSVFYAHRLAVFYMTGAWPLHDTDHRDGDRMNNRWANLREASRSQNLENQRKAKSHNKCGFLGVFAEKRKGVETGRFMAVIVVNKKRLWLGAFEKPETAHAAYLEAKRLHHLGS